MCGEKQTDKQTLGDISRVFFALPLYYLSEVFKACLEYFLELILAKATFRQLTTDNVSFG